MIRAVPLSRALHQVLFFFYVFDPGPRGSGGPWKAPLGVSKKFRARREATERKEKSGQERKEKIGKNKKGSLEQKGKQRKDMQERTCKGQARKGRKGNSGKRQKEMEREGKLTERKDMKERK